MQNLTGIKGLSEAKVDKICEAAEKIVVNAQIFHNLCDCVWSFILILNEHIEAFHTLALALVTLMLLFCFSFQNFGYITGSDALLRVSPYFFSRSLTFK